MSTYNTTNTSIQELFSADSKILMPITDISAIYDVNSDGTYSGSNLINNIIKNNINENTLDEVISGGDLVTDYSLALVNNINGNIKYTNIPLIDSSTMILAANGSFINASSLLKYTAGSGINITNNIISSSIIGDSVYTTKSTNVNNILISFSDYAKNIYHYNKTLSPGTEYLIKFIYTDVSTYNYQYVNINDIIPESADYTSNILVTNIVEDSSFTFSSTSLVDNKITGDILYKSLWTLYNKINNNTGSIAASTMTSDSSSLYYLLASNSNIAESKMTSVIKTYNSESNKIWITNFNLYQSSDEKYKEFIKDIDIDFDILKMIPKKEFYWKADKNKTIDIGTSAQVLESIYPSLVSHTQDVFGVSYNKLSIVALAAIDKLHDRIKVLEDTIEKLLKNS